MGLWQNMVSELACPQALCSEWPVRCGTSRAADQGAVLFDWKPWRTLPRPHRLFPDQLLEEPVISFAFRWIYNWTGAKFPYPFQAPLDVLQACWMAACKRRGWHWKQWGGEAPLKLCLGLRCRGWQRPGIQHGLIECVSQLPVQRRDECLLQITGWSAEPGPTGEEHSEMYIVQHISWLHKLSHPP